MPKSDKPLGQKVKAFRMALAISQREAARKLGISYNSFRRVESGQGCTDLTRAKIEKNIAKEEVAA